VCANLFCPSTCGGPRTRVYAATSRTAAQFFVRYRLLPCWTARPWLQLVSVDTHQIIRVPTRNGVGTAYDEAAAEAKDWNDPAGRKDAYISQGCESSTST
jgi:hypothetical protein